MSDPSQTVRNGLLTQSSADHPAGQCDRQLLLPGLLGMSVHTDCAYLKAIQARASAVRGVPVSSLRLQLHTLDFARLVGLARAGEWARAQDMIVDGAAALQRTGADVLVVTSSTSTSLAVEVADRIQLPMIDIVGASMRAARAVGVRTAGLLSTIRTRQSGIFETAGAAAGIEIVAPSAAVAAEVEAVIFEELMVGHASEQGAEVILRAIDRLAAQGAEAVLLACTDLTLLTDRIARSAALPIIDTVQVHGAAVADIALGLRGLHD